MKVKAVRQGFYDLKRVGVGQILDIPEHMFSDKWMEKIEEKKRVSGGSKSKVVEVVEEQVDHSDDEVI